MLSIVMLLKKFLHLILNLVLEYASKWVERYAFKINMYF